MKKISKNMKKILALVCSFAIVASSVFIEFPAKQAQASEESTIPSEEEQQTSSEQLKEITFDDFGISDGTYPTPGKAGKYQGGDTLIGTVFTGKVNFDTTSKNGILYIGGEDIDTSLLVRVGQGSIKVYTTAKNSSNNSYIPDNTYKFWVAANQETEYIYDFGFTSFVKQEFELKLSFECVNRDGDEVADDLKLGMWVNGVMCNQNSYIYAEDYVAKMGTHLQVTGMDTGGTPTVASVVSGAVPTGLKELTFNDFGIADNTYTTIKKGTYVDNLIGTVFTGKVKFADTVSTSATNGILYFGSSGDNALLVRVGGSSIKVYTQDKIYIPDETYKYWATSSDPNVKTYDFGFTSFKSQEFELKLSFECVNRDGDDVANDLKLGMWINGVMCNQNSYIYAEDYAGFMGNIIQISNASSPKVTSTVKDSLPAELKELTFKDFGIDNGTYTTSGDAGTYTGANNLINTVFSGKLKCDTDGKNSSGQDRDAVVYIGGTNDTTSLIVRVGRATIRVYTADLTSYGSESLGSEAYKFSYTDYNFDLTSFNGQEFDLKLSFECVNRDGGEVANDLKLGMWINGVMCNQNDYIYLNNYVDIMGTNLHILGGNDLYKAIPTITSTSSEDQTGVRFSSKRSFWDYGIGDGWYTNELVNGTLSLANAVSISTLFSGNFVFSPIGTTSLFFGGTSAENGFSLSTSGKNLILRDETNDTVIKTFYPGGAHATLVGTLLNVKFTYRDSKLGVWFNDRLYANEYIDALSFGNFMQITCDENANTRVISERFDMDIQSYSYDLAKGNYIISGEDTILVTNNGTVEKWNGDELTVAGDYEISTYGGLYKKSMTLYRTGDVHIDNETDVLDIVAALKVKKNGTEQKFIQLGADMNGDGTVNAIDISDIRCSLIGAATSEKLASIHYQEDAVGAIMPIVGKNTTWTVEELTQRDTIHALQAAGINLMDATGVSYNTNKNALYRALSFAEKYGIGMYATDGREHSDSTMSGISQAIKEYSQFTSLKGISDLQSLKQYAVPTTFATISIDSSSDATNVLMQVNRSLADGAKGVQYVWSDDIVDLDALVGNANAQIAAVDHILMNAKYKSQETETNYVMSTFDYQGKTAYYVVNSSLTDNAEVILDLTPNQQYQLYATSNNCSNSDTEGTGQCTLTLTPGGAALVLLQ